ncbi:MULTISPECIES: terminase small subunit [Bacillus]|nr:MULTISPECIES: terminase small subunit [Bacillales]MCA4144935.1 terminase small subunit [Bacillus subtilis]MCR4362565.1 terminase small subunit [Bacillus subtilis]MCS7396046.1 terminase small subunit [Bacillus subtilis]MCT7915834.1 terminase small subunit [Bacillus subtilis]MCT7939195.1 terminase small subunit [Bacillus subtilis]
MKLTERQRRFCDFFTETRNTTEATRLAGNKGKNLNRVASQNLSKLDIQTI